MPKSEKGKDGITAVYFDTWVAPYVPSGVVAVSVVQVSGNTGSESRISDASDKQEEGLRICNPLPVRQPRDRRQKRGQQQPRRAEVRRALASQPEMPTPTVTDACPQLIGLRDQLAEGEAAERAQIKERKKIRRACQFAAGVGVLKRMIRKIREGHLNRGAFEDFLQQLIKVTQLDPKSRGKKHLLQRLGFTEEERELRRIYRASKERDGSRLYVGNQWRKIDLSQTKSEGRLGRFNPFQPLGGEAAEWFDIADSDPSTEDYDQHWIDDHAVPVVRSLAPVRDEGHVVLFVFEQTAEEFWETQLSA